MSREKDQGGAPIVKTDNPLRRLKRRIAANGPGLTVAVIAMLIALTGGAFAAAGALNATQKKEVKKIAQAEAKKFAKAGPAGATGAPGAKGDKGDKGDQGGQGAPGKAGTSVGVSEIPLGEAECEERGGALVEKEGTPGGVEVCAGEEGSPWTAGGTLPPGATETGSWAFNGTEADAAGGIRVPISFPIPLAQEIVKNPHVHFGIAGSGGAFEAGGACPTEGGLEGPGAFEPTALPGELCVYQNVEEGLFGASFSKIYRYAENSKGATSAGAVLLFEPTGPVAIGAGSFAVTGCSEEVGAAIPCPA
jgi:hypothetical protein